MSTARIVDWIIPHGLNVLVVLVGAILVVRAARALIGRLERSVGHGQHADRDLEWQRRASTLAGILTRLVTVSVWFVAVLMLFRELQIDVMPVLTGAGIAGLAIGFGAQNLVRDVISGFFLILEDQVRVGDAARINGVTGTIEHVNLRTIVLRDGEGAVHVFPNGTVSALANLSKQFSNAIVDIKVPYVERIDRVLDAIRAVGRSMEADADWAPMLLAPVDTAGVEAIADGAATVRARLKTQPLMQGRVANEFRRRLLEEVAARRIALHGAAAVAAPPVEVRPPRAE